MPFFQVKPKRQVGSNEQTTFANRNGRTIQGKKKIFCSCHFDVSGVIALVIGSFVASELCYLNL